MPIDRYGGDSQRLGKELPQRLARHGHVTQQQILEAAEALPAHLADVGHVEAGRNLLQRLLLALKFLEPLFAPTDLHEHALGGLAFGDEPHEVVQLFARLPYFRFKLARLVRVLPQFLLDDLGRLFDGVCDGLGLEHLLLNRFDDRAVEPLHACAVIVGADRAPACMVIGAAVVVDLLPPRWRAAVTAYDGEALSAASAATHSSQQVFLRRGPSPPLAAVADINSRNFLQPLLCALPKHLVHNPKVRAVSQLSRERHLPGVALAVEDFPHRARRPGTRAALPALRRRRGASVEVPLAYRVEVASQRAPPLAHRSAFGAVAVERLGDGRVAVAISVGAEYAADHFRLLLVNVVVGVAPDLLAVHSLRVDLHVVIAVASTARVVALRRLSFQSITRALARLFALKLRAEGHGVHHKLIDGSLEAKLLVGEVEEDAPALVVDIGQHAAGLGLLASEP